jgi:co-chaperonin GroES (HSP10)
VGNNILVVKDPIAQVTRGGIHLPSVLSGEDMSNTGTIVAVGHLTTPKAAFRTPIPGLQQGMGVTFVKFHEKQNTNEYLLELSPGLLRLRPADVFLTFDREEDLFIFRPDLCE